MLRTLVAAAALAACAKETVSPPPADKPAPPPAQPAPPQLETRDIVVKHVDDQAAVRARVPSDWVGSGQSFRPPARWAGNRSLPSTSPATARGAPPRCRRTRAPRGKAPPRG